MKQLIKRIPALLLLVGLSTGAWAQNTDNAAISATATVVTSIEFDGTTDANNLIFGNVTPGNSKTIAADGSVAEGTATGGEQAGWFVVNKGADTQITLSFVLPTELTSGSNELDIEFDPVGGNSLARITDTDGDDEVLFDPADGISIVNADDTEGFFGSESFEIHIGGTVTPDASQEAGEYEGEITLTAIYN